MVTCPLCESAIDVDEDGLEEGGELVCEECGAELRVAELEPLELEVVAEEDKEEDLDEDGEDGRWR